MFIILYCHVGFYHSELTFISSNTVLKRYFCKECLYSTIDRSNLKRHARTHTQERPYVCAVCGKAFTRKSNLDIHVMKHNFPN
ncbi:hypothetical protein NPIL_554201 [Nephila pilipes]|uniref:C2H2-type domain-containing protein n=1 Tax=Nephila pilipes TaxID=299642 RepID=A0A8X6NRB1_NEPPI|nr:hypothetical protein NPIL_554201 [Nephila pilipes]